MIKKVIFYGLFAILFVLLILSNFNRSLTWDEAPFILNGLYYLKDGETFNSLQPIFGGILAAFPLLFLNIQVIPYKEINHVLNDSRKVFPYYGNNDISTITFWSHIPFIILSLIFAYYVYRWSKELYGENAGLFALFLYTFSVTILAWSVSANPDLLSVGLAFISLYYFWKFLNSDTKNDLILSAILLGLAISSKISVLYLLPAYVINFFVIKNRLNELKNCFKVFLIFSVINLFTIMAVHVLDTSPIYDVNDMFYQNDIGRQFRTSERLELILDNFVERDSLLREILKFSVSKVPLPGKTFLQTIYSHTKGGGKGAYAGGRVSFLLGEWKIGGWWYYYFMVMLLKVPISVLVFCLGSFVFFNKIRSKWKNEIYLLIPISIWFTTFSFLSRIDTGIRHMLLISLLMIVFTSKLVNLKFNLFNRLVFLGLCVWLVIAVITSFPFYMSYFNEFIDPLVSYKYLGSDNLDIGQDVMHISKYVKNNNLEDVKINYHGPEILEYRGVKYTNLGCEPVKGNIIISGAVLQGAVYDRSYRRGGPDMNCFSWLYNERPIDNIGNSIFVYKIE